MDPPVEESPWKKYTDMAMYAMLASAVLTLVAKQLTKMAKGPQAIYFYAAAIIAAYAAIAAALLVIFAGYKLMSEFGQKWTGIMYMAAGAMLIMKALEALSGVGESAGKNTSEGFNSSSKWFDLPGVK